MKATFFITTLLTFLFINSGFFSSQKYSVMNEDEDITKIIYEYIDASVAPQYHRSYTINISPDTVFFEINSYGDTLLQKYYDITPEYFDSLLITLENFKIDNCREKENKGCAGGTGEHIEFHSDSLQILSHE